MFWHNLINKGLYVSANQIICCWTLHSLQRHNINYYFPDDLWIRDYHHDANSNVYNEYLSLNGLDGIGVWIVKANQFVVFRS